ncbi:hypothetical protein Asp14428_39980 [Actinoplanes sp. NBRC 14428]|nr:hypothetical protein Asp14428_39980 [Actinoplanes sp. NBRC 14428]
MGRQRTLTLVIAGAVVLGAGGAAVAARSGGDRSAAAPRPSAGSVAPERVVLPGKPGDPAVVTDSDKVRPPDAPTYNAIDTTFVQMMIVHHGQAIEMAKLAPERAGDARLRALAARIGAAQAPRCGGCRAGCAIAGCRPAPGTITAPCPACSPTPTWRPWPGSTAPRSTGSSSR